MNAAGLRILKEALTELCFEPALIVLSQRDAYGLCAGSGFVGGDLAGLHFHKVPLAVADVPSSFVVSSDMSNEYSTTIHFLRLPLRHD